MMKVNLILCVLPSLTLPTEPDAVVTHEAWKNCDVFGQCITLLGRSRNTPDVNLHTDFDGRVLLHSAADAFSEN